MTDADKLRAIINGEFSYITGNKESVVEFLSRIASLLDAVPPETLEALWAGTWQAVPKKPISETMWGGLARDLMMWLDIYGAGNRTPRNLFAYLKNVGRDIPQWLKDEPEMQDLDYVPSKGTRVVLIFKAMLAAAPKKPEG